MGTLEGDIWVFDTSSVINVKELIKPRHRETVLGARTQEVVKELHNGVKKGKPDLLLEWATEYSRIGCRLGPCFDKLRIVMNHPIARLTPDPSKAAGEDDADPHVLATALEVVELRGNAIVVTQESRKQPPQVPLNVAAAGQDLGLIP